VRWVFELSDLTVRRNTDQSVAPLCPRGLPLINGISGFSVSGPFVRVVSSVFNQTKRQVRTDWALGHAVNGIETGVQHSAVRLTPSKGS